MIGSRLAEVQQLVVGQSGDARHQSQLVQGDAGPDLDRERHRDDFQEELALVPVPNLVEVATHVGDDPREHVQPSGRAARVRSSSDPLRQPQPLLERDQIWAVLLEDSAFAGEVDLVHRVLAELLANQARARQEAAPQPIGDVTEGQVDARRLDIPIRDLDRRGDVTLVDEHPQRLPGEDALAFVAFAPVRGHCAGRGVTPERAWRRCRGCRSRWCRARRRGCRPRA